MLCSRKLPLAKTFGVRSLGRGDALRPLDLTPFLFPRLLGGSISPDRKLPSGKPGPPCKSGQLKKDLGLEVSSARHAARLVIFEIMRSFFSLVQGAPVPHGTRTILTRRMTRCGLTSADSGLQLDLEIALNGVSAKIQ